MIQRVIISLMFVCLLSGCSIAPPPPPPMPQGDYRPVNKIVPSPKATTKQEKQS